MNQKALFLREPFSCLRLVLLLLRWLRRVLFFLAAQPVAEIPNAFPKLAGDLADAPWPKQQHDDHKYDKKFGDAEVTKQHFCSLRGTLPQSNRLGYSRADNLSLF